jgi:hypothetical protein
MKRVSAAFVAVAGVLLFLLFASLAGASSAGTNVPVTDQTYVSADVMGGTGSYSDDVLTRCSTNVGDRSARPQCVDERGERLLHDADRRGRLGWLLSLD